MNCFFTVSDKEGNEIRVSLSSFSQTGIEALLGETELIDISLERIKDTGKPSHSILSLLTEKICTFIQNNKHCVFYYYCDEVNAIPNIRKSKSISPAEYRNNLFSVLFERGKQQYPELNLEDKPIIIETDEGKAFIHLI